MDEGLATRVLLVDGAVELIAGEVHRTGTVVALRSREVELLSWFSANAHRTVRRQELLRAVWGYRGGARTRVVDVTIRRLREKIEVDPGEPRHLLTVRGVGYRFVPEELSTTAPGPGDWEALSEGQQSALSALSTFCGPFSSEGATVLLPSDVAPWQVLHGLLRAGALILNAGLYRIVPSLLGIARSSRVEADRRELDRRHMTWAVGLRGPAAWAMIDDVLSATELALDLGDLSAAMEGCAALNSVQSERRPLAALVLSRLARAEGALGRAETLAEEAVAAARAQPAPRRLAEALRGLAWQRNHQGQLSAAIALLEDAERAAVEADAPLLLARIRTDLAVNAVESGNLKRAERLLTGARANVRMAGSPPAAEADLQVSSGLVALASRCFADAISSFGAAEALYIGLDEPRGVGWAVNNLGEAFLHDGQVSRAAECFRRSAEWFASAGTREIVVPQINLAVLALRVGPVDAVPLRALLAEAVAEGRLARAGQIHALLASCSVWSGDHNAAHTHLQQTIDLVHQTGFTGLMLATQAERLAVQAAESGWVSLQKDALRLALAQRRRLHDPESAARLSALLQD
jgi:DNA-binding winged helix-turn-helix (wHTH) protein/tetratricopeptide (TPR) repeat protein